MAVGTVYHEGKKLIESVPGKVNSTSNSTNPLFLFFTFFPLKADKNIS